MHSINPELWKKSREPTSTVAMGMKQSLGSAICWAAQVEREQQTAKAWQMRYDPQNTQEAQALQALERTIEREKQSREDYSDPQKNPELYTILYRQNLDAATSRFKHEKGREGDVATSSDTAGATSTGRGPVSAAFASPSTFETTSKATVAYLPPVYRTKPYLEARCSQYTPQQRYPQYEPPTSAMVVGWHCKNSLLARSNADLYKPVRPNVMGPYRNPEDADHGVLFGYDLQSK